MKSIFKPNSELFNVARVSGLINDYCHFGDMSVTQAVTCSVLQEMELNLFDKIREVSENKKQYLSMYRKKKEQG